MPLTPGPRRALPFVLAALALCAPVLPVDSARAQTQQEITAAKAAFNAGLALEAAGDYAQALTRFREVIAVKVTPQALFHIGRCLERLGKWTEAVGNYRLAIEKAEETRAAEAGREAEVARSALEPKVPKLVIRRGRGAAAANIALDGVALGATAIDVELPIDPGPHTVIATVPGQRPTTVEITVAEAETKNVVLDLEGPRPQTGHPISQPPFVAWSWKRAGYTIGAAGLASLAIGGVFLALRQSTLSKLDDQCVDNHCPASLEDTYDKGKRYTIVGDVFLGMGIVGVATGAGFVIWGKDSPSSSSSASRAILIPASSSGLGATVSGVF